MSLLFIEAGNVDISETHTAWKVSVFEVFLVRIFRHSDWILTRKTPNRDTFHEVTDELLEALVLILCNFATTKWETEKEKSVKEI